MGKGPQDPAIGYPEHDHHKKVGGLTSSVKMIDCITSQNYKSNHEAANSLITYFFTLIPSLSIATFQMLFFCFILNCAFSFSDMLCLLNSETLIPSFCIIFVFSV